MTVILIDVTIPFSHLP